VARPLVSMVMAPAARYRGACDGGLGRRPRDDRYFAFCAVMSDVPVSTFFGTCLPSTAAYSVAIPIEPIFAGCCATLADSLPALIAVTSSGRPSKPTSVMPLAPAFLIDWIAPSAGGPHAE